MKIQHIKKTKKKKTLIIDTDCGADDLLAIDFLHKNQFFNIQYIITSYGCYEEPAAYSRLISYLDDNNYKTTVIRGSQKPTNYIFYKHKNQEHIHGPIPKIILQNKSEKQKIENTKVNPNTTYLVLGPLTNICKILKDEKKRKNISKIICMGGTLHNLGNITQYQEANLYKDSSSLKELLDYNIKPIFVTLDLTEKTQIINLTTNKSAILRISHQVYQKFYKSKKWIWPVLSLKKIKYYGACAQDLIAAVYCSYPGYFTKKQIIISKKMSKRGVLQPISRPEHTVIDTGYIINVLIKQENKKIKKILNDFGVEIKIVA